MEWWRDPVIVALLVVGGILFFIPVGIWMGARVRFFHTGRGDSEVLPPTSILLPRRKNR